HQTRIRIGGISNPGSREVSRPETVVDQSVSGTHGKGLLAPLNRVRLDRTHAYIEPMQLRARPLLCAFKTDFGRGRHSWLNLLNEYDVQSMKVFAVAKPGEVID